MSTKPFYKHEAAQKKVTKTPLPGTVTIKKSLHQTNFAKVEENAEEGNLQVERVSRDLQLKIQQGRAAKQWTQAKLGFECNLPTSVIRDYENGSAVLKQKEITLIMKALEPNFKNN